MKSIVLFKSSGSSIDTSVEFKTFFKNEIDAPLLAADFFTLQNCIHKDEILEKLHFIKNTGNPGNIDCEFFLDDYKIKATCFVFPQSTEEETWWVGYIWINACKQDDLLLELPEQESQYEILEHTLMSHAPQSIWFKNTEGVYEFVNVSFLQLSGKHDIFEIIGKTDVDLWGGAANRFLETDRVALNSNNVSIFEEYYEAYGSKTKIWVETLKIPVFNSHGLLLGIMGISQDITERKEKEYDLKLSTLVFDSIDEGVLILNQDGIVLSANPSVKLLTGYNPETLKGKSFNVLFPTSENHKEQRDAVFEILGKRGSLKNEVYLRKSNGEEFIAHIIFKTTYIDDVAAKVMIFSDITEKKNYDDSIKKLAHFDVLTELPNRALLHDRFKMSMSIAQRERHFLAIFFMDLNKFKPINDTLGHAVGDFILKEVSVRITESIRSSDTAARVGGDEFVVLLNLPTTEESVAREQAKMVAKTIVEALEVPFLYQDHVLSISTSIGISLSTVDGLSEEELIEKADKAMYNSKRNGPGSIAFYKEER